jgi:hypothetical protein
MQSQKAKPNADTTSVLLDRQPFSEHVILPLCVSICIVEE